MGILGTMKTLAAGAAALAVLGGGAASAKEFRLGLITPPPHIWTKAAEAFGADLEEATGGAHSLQVFPAQQLGNEAQMLQQLQTGALDMAWLTTAEITFRVPDMAALHAPFLVDNIEDAAKVLRSDLAREILGTLPRATGTVGVCYAMIGMRQLVLREQIDSAADLSGQRIRITPAPAISDFFEMFGAAPAPMPLPAIYDALANGQIDGLDMDYESIINFRYYEHAPHLLETNHHMFGMVALISAPVWAQLSEEDRALITDATQMHCDRTIDRFVEEEEDKLARLREAPGIQITEDVGREFFGDIVECWDAEWGEQTPYVARMRELVASF